MHASIEKQLEQWNSQANSTDERLSALREQICYIDADLAALAEQFVEIALDEWPLITRMADLTAAAPLANRTKWAPLVIARYKKFVNDAKECLPTIEAALRQGYEIKGIAAFRESIQDAEAVVSNADRWLNGIAQLDAGRGIPLQEAMDELRRRARA
jgi:hypothetical protein